MSFKKPLYGDVRFIDSPSKNQKSSKVNIKPTYICHDVPSPDLLERPKLTPEKKNRSYLTLPHPYIDIQPATRGCK